MQPLKENRVLVDMLFAQFCQFLCGMTRKSVAASVPSLSPAHILTETRVFRCSQPFDLGLLDSDLGRVLTWLSLTEPLASTTRLVETSPLYE